MQTFILLSVALISFALQKAETVKFPSKDGLSVTADWYRNDKRSSVIVLCHQAGSSRGEYTEIAARLNALGFNCLAVDLRSGDEVNGIRNETAQEAQIAGKSRNYVDAEQDMIAAVEYARKEYPGMKITLFGSSYSASLALKIGKDHSDVYAVIAFSPGEYFGEELNMRKSIAGFGKPAFVTGSRKEYSEISHLFNYVQGSFVTVYSPSAEGMHGSRALLSSSEGSQEYWDQLKKFFHRIE